MGGTVPKSRASGWTTPKIVPRLLQESKRRELPYPIPPPLPNKLWRPFFLAARYMVECRARKTPGLLKAWDMATRRLEIRLLHPTMAREDPPEGFELLLTIMVDPRRAKAPRSTMTDATLLHTYSKVKALLDNCRTIRRKHGLKGRYEPCPDMFLSDFEEWKATAEYLWGRGCTEEVIRTDSPRLYQLALCQRFLGTTFPDDVLDDCATRLWSKPAQAALVVMAHITGRDPDYLSRRFSTIRRRLYKPPTPGQ